MKPLRKGKKPSARGGSRKPKQSQAEKSLTKYLKARHAAVDKYLHAAHTAQLKKERAAVTAGKTAARTAKTAGRKQAATAKRNQTAAKKQARARLTSAKKLTHRTAHHGSDQMSLKAPSRAPGATHRTAKTVAKAKSSGIKRPAAHRRKTRTR